MLKGYKTYLLAALTAAGALVSYLVGEITVAQAIQLAVTAGLSCTIRNAIPPK